MTRTTSPSRGLSGSLREKFGGRRVWFQGQQRSAGCQCVHKSAQLVVSASELPAESGTVHILGTHGVPAAYGGFETAAQHIGLYLRDRGWRVIVYCQEVGHGPTFTDTWCGLERVRIHEPRQGWLGTASFDWTCVRYVLGNAAPGDICLTFGYNTGVFNVLQRVVGIPNVINMDGMEWTRARWGLLRQGILLGNERFAGAVGDVLIADHPVIAKYLERHFGRRRVRTITYGAHAVDEAPIAPVRALGLTPGSYATVICRPIPENSLLDIARAWSRRDRGMPVVFLGDYSPDDNYHRQVRADVGEEASFPGAIYEPETVRALRYHSALYLHGHTVGGTNPSLVEAMAAHNAVVAHDNAYNRWVLGEAGRFFTDSASLDAILTRLLADANERRVMGDASFARFEEEFTWEHIGDLYEQALLVAGRRRRKRASSAAITQLRESLGVR